MSKTLSEDSGYDVDDDFAVEILTSVKKRTHHTHLRSFSPKTIGIDRPLPREVFYREVVYKRGFALCCIGDIHMVAEISLVLPEEADFILAMNPYMCSNGEERILQFLFDGTISAQICSIPVPQIVLPEQGFVFVVPKNHVSLQEVLGKSRIII